MSDEDENLLNSENYYNHTNEPHVLLMLKSINMSIMYIFPKASHLSFEVEMLSICRKYEKS